MLMCQVINSLMKAVGCTQRAAVDFATTVDREVCCDAATFVSLSSFLSCSMKTDCSNAVLLLEC